MVNILLGGFVDVLEGFGVVVFVIFIDVELDNGSLIFGQFDEVLLIIVYYEMDGFEICIVVIDCFEFLIYQCGGFNKIDIVMCDVIIVVDV